MERLTLSVGMIELEIPNHGDNSYTTKAVDLFAFTHGLLEAGRREHLADKPADAATARALWLNEQGFPGVLPAEATELLNRLWEKLEAVKKNGPLNGKSGTPVPSDSRRSFMAPQPSHPG
jgi:hypothetical protein